MRPNQLSSDYLSEPLLLNNPNSRFFGATNMQLASAGAAVKAWLIKQTRIPIRWRWAKRHSCKECLKVIGLLFLFLISYVIIWITLVHFGSNSSASRTPDHSSTSASRMIYAGFALSVFISAGFFVGFMTAAAKVDQAQTNLLICLFGFALFATVTIGMFAANHGDIANGDFSDTLLGNVLRVIVSELMNLNSSLSIAILPFVLLLAPQLLSMLILGPVGYAVPIRLGRSIMKFMLGGITKGFLCCAAVLLGIQILVIFNDWPGGQTQFTMSVVAISEVLLIGAAVTCWAWAEINAGLAASQVGVVMKCLGRNTNRKFVFASKRNAR